MISIGKFEEKSYLQAPWADWIFVHLAPLYSLLFVWYYIPLEKNHIEVAGLSIPMLGLIYFLVQGFGDTTTIFRAYLNPEVNKQFWVRLWVLPLILLTLCTVSDTFFVLLFLVEIFYDIWHSALQNWGIVRIYDVKMGNDPNLGRSEDRILNLIVYGLPILAGIHFPHMMDSFKLGEYTALPWLSLVPSYFKPFAHHFSVTLIWASAFFLIYYIYRYKKLCDDGYVISPQKVVLMFSVGILCFYCGWWASFGAFYLGINIFHSVHTVYIAWWSERKNVIKNFKLDGLKNPTVIVAFVFLLAILIAGQGEILADYYEDDLYAKFESGGTFNLSDFNSGWIGWVIRIRLVTTFMHYYADSFIWSLRKKTLNFQKDDR